MASFNAELLQHGLNLALALLFVGALVHLARLNQRLTALRGAQSELHGLLRSCSDNVDTAEKSIARLRSATQEMAVGLGRSLDEAERLKADIDATCAAARRLLARLEEGPAPAPFIAAVPEPRPVPPAPPVAAPADAVAEADPAPKPAVATGAAEPRWVIRRQRPAAPPAPAPEPKTGERAALRFFRETFRGL
ncbi:DUF6468 domain-containing protein [Rhodocista pekingensis]|uniref:DUF6468 domain-containing protein n=1 Tax=Rhodocista pekingensis TaxID=201185 RepID=A0ABW2KYS5_9PROT